MVGVWVSDWNGKVWVKEAEVTIMFFFLILWYGNVLFRHFTLPVYTV